MDFAGAIKAAFQNYANFRGVASRAAFWYWRLFLFIVSIATTFIPLLGTLTSIAFLLPDLAVGIRRSRDAGFSAWLQLLWLIPFGSIFYAVPQLVVVAQNNQMDFENATDAELLQLLSQLVPAVLPILLTFAAVSIFFLVTYLMPTKTAAQGNKYVK